MTNYHNLVAASPSEIIADENAIYTVTAHRRLHHLRASEVEGCAEFLAGQGLEVSIFRSEWSIYHNRYNNTLIGQVFPDRGWFRVHGHTHI